MSLLPNLKYQYFSTIITSRKKIIFLRIKKHSSHIIFHRWTKWVQISQTSLINILINLYISFLKWYKYSFIYSISLNTSYLTWTFMFIYYHTSICISYCYPSIRWCWIYYLVELIQMDSYHVPIMSCHQSRKFII